MPAKSMLERLSDKVLVGDDCWEWTAAKDRAGYGFMMHEGKRLAAHRATYELIVGPIPKGLVLDHLCRNPGCVRPLHLEPVTQKENVHRGLACPKSHCHRGHPLSGDNLYVSPKGERKCQACMKILNRKYRDEGRGYTRCQPKEQRTRISGRLPAP